MSMPPSEAQRAGEADESMVGVMDLLENYAMPLTDQVRFRPTKQKNFHLESIPN